MASTAFQITEDDVENVLRRHSLRVSNTQGKSFAEMAGVLFDDLDHGRVERAALTASSDLEEQTLGAYEEIKVILVEMGVLTL
ncbi:MULTISPECIES: hypothetical protein [Pseudomonas]|uniref:Uncharacterized protein n=1 Tax=Pseudomonas fluorescens TaxID=294 RepID=A0A166QNF6_PSEFL|nr:MULTISPECIES: hypothetical protein [Pseudomonas]KZN20583.1 hypothetical protein A1D17_03325 [Pseudomonas fluorescens]